MSDVDGQRRAAGLRRGRASRRPARAPTKAMRTPVAVAAASATGMSERGRYSKSSSSTASSTAETGLPKVAAMPAAAPAASSVLRSSAVVVEDLPEQRAERAAGGDDGPLGAERAAGADGDGRRERLEERDARRDAALVGEHLLHRLGDAVAADGLRAVARHEPDDEAPTTADDDDPAARGGCRRASGSSERRPKKARLVTRSMRLEHLRHARGQHRDSYRQRTDVRRPPGDVRRVRSDVRLGQPRPQRRRDRKSLGGGAGKQAGDPQPRLRARMPVGRARLRDRVTRGSPSKNMGVGAFSSMPMARTTRSRSRSSSFRSAALSCSRASRSSAWGDRRGGAEEPLAGGGQPQGGASRIVRRDSPHDQSTLGEAVHHDRDRAGVGEGSPRPAQPSSPPDPRRGVPERRAAPRSTRGATRRRGRRAAGHAPAVSAPGGFRRTMWRLPWVPN